MGLQPEKTRAAQHTCDEFESGIREIFLSFQGGF